MKQKPIRNGFLKNNKLLKSCFSTRDAIMPVTQSVTDNIMYTIINETFTATMLVSQASIKPIPLDITGIKGYVLNPFNA